MKAIVDCMKTRFLIPRASNISDKMLKTTKKKASVKSKAVAVTQASTIKDFFQNAPSTSNVCVEEKREKPSDSRAVYVQALKRRIIKNYNEKENIGNDTAAVTNKNEIAANDQKNQKCVDIVQLATDDPGRNGNNCKGTGNVDSVTDDEDYDNAVVLDGKNADKWDASLQKKYKDLKKDHFQLCHKYCELSMKYDQLLETLNAVRQAKSSDAEFPDVPSPTDDVFTANQVRILESLPLEKKKDSTFVLKCVEYAYTGNTSALVNKTLFGTLERIEFGNDGAVVVRPAKGAMTPEKVKRIEELFVKRVTESKCLAAEFSERISPTNINRLIGSAVANVTNKENPKKGKQNVNLNL